MSILFLPAGYFCQADRSNELTAQNIKRFITARDMKKPDPPDLSDRITLEYMATVKAMLEQVRAARHDDWQATSRQAALLWNRVIKEKILSKGSGFYRNRPIH